MASHKVIARAYHGSRIIDIGETVEWPDSKKLPSWLSSAGLDEGAETVAVPSPVSRKKTKADEPESAGMTGVPSPVPSTGADWVKPNT
jgi:hypothetical protein